MFSCFKPTSLVSFTGEGNHVATFASCRGIVRTLPTAVERWVAGSPSSVSCKVSAAAAPRTRDCTSNKWINQTHLSRIQNTQCCPVKTLMSHCCLLAAVHWWIPPPGNLPALSPHRPPPARSLVNPLHYRGRPRRDVAVLVARCQPWFWAKTLAAFPLSQELLKTCISQ